MGVKCPFKVMAQGKEESVSHTLSPWSAVTHSDGLASQPTAISFDDEAANQNRGVSVISLCPLALPLILFNQDVIQPSTSCVTEKSTFLCPGSSIH